MTIAVSMGDPSGIGPEIALKTWLSRKDFPNIDFSIIGSLSPFEKCSKEFGLNVPIQKISDISEAKGVFDSALPILEQNLLEEDVIFGKPNSKNANAIIKSIEYATGLCLKGEAEAITTIPIAKSVLYSAGFKFPGHTEFIGFLCKNAKGKTFDGPVMMLAIEGLRVALVTIHEPFIKVPQLINIDSIVHLGKLINDSLQQDFGVEKPNIALLGLNPHAGEDGTIGKEEVEIINPAAEVLRNLGINITNALPADTAFSPYKRSQFDAYIAMYHDQGLIPVKALDFDNGVNISLGLPIIRTSPDHGTGFDIAGKNIANPNSLICALKSAKQISENRKKYCAK